MAISLWTFAFIVLGILFFYFAMMGDCIKGPTEKRADRPS